MGEFRQLIVLVVVGLFATACGGGHGANGSVAVRVEDGAIATAQVDHWMSIVAAGESTAPGAPKPDVPTPPDYSGCIVYLATYVAGQAHASHQALRSECELEYQKEKLKALYSLITYRWVRGEAAELGVRISHAQLAGVLALFKHQTFPDGHTFAQYLAEKRFSENDIASVLELSLLVPKVQRRLEAQPSLARLSPTQRQAALQAFGVAYERKWKARTDCAEGYVVPICAQYRAPAQPPKLVPPTVPLTNLAPS
jgi:hypothetical protein